MLRRLGKDSNHNTWKLTIGEDIVNMNEWTEGMYLWFKTSNKVLRYSNIEKEGSKRLKLMHTNVWFVHVPNAIIEAYEFKKGQQFALTSTRNSITFNPFEYGTTLYGVANPKKTVNNLPKKEEGVAIESLP